MSKYLKYHVTRRVLNILTKERPLEKEIEALASQVKLKKTSDLRIALSVPVTSVAQSAGLNDVTSCVKEVEEKLKTDNIVSDINFGEEKGRPNILFNLHRENYIQCVLNNNPSKKAAPPCNKSVLIEFSSPNIAKPFHIGHLRSTIIGNFIANLHEWFGFNVVRLNYLGDWGTQFGLVKIGMDMLNPSPEELKQKPLLTLYQAYVLANTAAEKNPEIRGQARQIFSNLETGKESDLLNWKLYREFTLGELKATYSRLGIKFDKYSWESDYKASSIRHILDLMNSFGCLKVDEEGLSSMNVNNKVVPLLKSDGTTLYLTRDIAAAIDRREQYKFDEMLYLADASQHGHFQNLFQILKDLNFSWSENLKHISFGRVRGMSTRQGKAVFLNDILNEAHNLMVKQQEASPNTRVDLKKDMTTADILGISSIIVADLVHKRRKDYTFNWDSARSVTGNTGVRLQYTHCRLTSLAEKSSLAIPSKCDPDALSEPAAINLVYEISRFDEVLQNSFEELEASRLTEYLFTLCDVTNRAFKTLRVSDAGKVGEQRLLLFEEARSVLYRGMKLLGLTPLDRM